MSLLNDVLRDLQTRGVFGVPPLAGLQPVAEIPAHQRKRALLLPILAGVFVASVVVLWRPVADGRWFPSFAQIAADAPAQPQAESQSDTMTSMQIEPAAVVATGDDLRELFSVDNPVESRPASHSEFAADTAADAPTASTIAAEMPPPPESREVTNSSPSTATPTALVSPQPTESVAAIESPPPTASAAPPQATGTGVMRREPAADDAQGLVARAVKAMHSNDLFTAESMFRAALVVDSGDVEIWSYLYSVLARTSRPEAAEQVLQQGLIAADEPAALAKLYARMLLDRGEKDAAVSILKIHRPPAASDIEYDSFLAALLQQQGQYAEAGEIYELLLTVDPGSSSIWIGLAMSHDSLGNREDALAAFERALTTGSLKPPLARYARRRSTELRADD
jgi:Flp pilus assembly protein TadD